MAYMNQEKKKELAPGIKGVFKKHGFKGSISVRNYSTLVVTISHGSTPEPIIEPDERGVFRSVLSYEQPEYKKIWEDFMGELRDAANVGNFDKSESMVDHFDVGWYVDINVGKFKKPYTVI